MKQMFIKKMEECGSTIGSQTSQTVTLAHTSNLIGAPFSNIPTFAI